MDHEEGKEALTAFLKKYRWVAAVVLAGLLLMALPETAPRELPQPEPAETEPGPGLEQKLEGLLSGLQGAGQVRVLLTQAAGEQIYYQTDGEQGEHSQDQQTVLITGADRSETGLVKRIDPPRWLGAVVLCQGGDRASVRLAVVEAVSAATGLTSDRISVLKMK